MNMMTPPASRLDYFPCHYGGSRLLFRGPQRRLRGDFVACLGGTETFGRFIRSPYPDLLETAIGRPCVNLGCQAAGVDAFASAPALIDIAALAGTTVIEVMGAANMSNRHYTVDPRRNDRFIRASKRLKQLYPEIDFRGFQTTASLLAALAREDPDRLQVVRRELQTAWVARMRTLIRQVGGRVILLWLADHAPYSKDLGGTLCRAPLFVDRAMLDAACSAGAELVEVVVPPAETRPGRAEMVFSELDGPAARGMLGPVAHRRAVLALAPYLLGVRGRQNAR